MRWINLIAWLGGNRQSHASWHELVLAMRPKLLSRRFDSLRASELNQLIHLLVGWIRGPSARTAACCIREARREYHWYDNKIYFVVIDMCTAGYVTSKQMSANFVSVGSEEGLDEQYDLDCIMEMLDIMDLGSVKFDFMAWVELIYSCGQVVDCS